MSKDIKPWKLVSRKNILDTKWIRVDSETLDTPGGRINDYYVIHEPSWSCCVAVTPSNKFLFVKQYRRGANIVSLELPAGDLDPNESAEMAAIRELEEETGYQVIKKPEYLGKMFPEPAKNDNVGHGWLVHVAEEPKKKQSLDAFEQIRIELLDVEQVKKAIFDGTIQHSCHIAFLFRALFKLGLAKF